MKSNILQAKNFIKNLDQFGVVFKPSITQDAEYKTVLGGVLSILLYGLSLGYFIYQFVQWNEGGMLPKITLSSEVIVDQKIYFQDPILSIKMRQYKGNPIDPFDPQNLIMMPLMIPIVNGLYTKPSLPKISKNNAEEFTTIYFQNFTLAISSEKTTENPELEISIILVDCVQSFLPSEMNCANITTRKQFFNQSVNTIFFTTYINQFNAQKEELNTFASEIVLALDITTSYYATNTLKLQETIVDDGILFENKFQRDFILDISTTGQQLNGKFFSGVINTTTYFINNYQLNGIKSIQYIQYPKVNEVLADIGSIVSLLLLTSAFVIMINQYWLENEALDKVIGMFYPNLKLIKFNKNWYGKVIGIDYQGKQLNIQKYNENYSKLKVVAQTKLTITNQIYETSRLQFIIQSVLPRQQFVQSHFIGIKENNVIEYLIQDDSQIENSNEFSRIKETKIVIVNKYNKQPSNENKIEIYQNQLAQNHDPSNLTSDFPSENEQNVKKLANVQQNQNIQNIYQLCDQDFELLIYKERQKPEQMSQFYEINQIV